MGDHQRVFAIFLNDVETCHRRTAEGGGMFQNSVKHRPIVALGIVNQLQDFGRRRSLCVLLSQFRLKRAEPLFECLARQSNFKNLSVRPLRQFKTEDKI